MAAGLLILILYFVGEHSCCSWGCWNGKRKLLLPKARGAVEEDPEEFGDADEEDEDGRKVPTTEEKAELMSHELNQE